MMCHSKVDQDKYPCFGSYYSDMDACLSCAEKIRCSEFRMNAENKRKERSKFKILNRISLGQYSEKAREIDAKAYIMPQGT